MLFLTYLKAERQERSVPRYRSCNGCSVTFHVRDLAPLKKGYICTDCKDLLYPPIDFSRFGKDYRPLRGPEFSYMLRIDN